MYTIHYTRWSYIFLFITTFLLLLLFGFNYLVDPYGNKEVVCKNIYKPILNERAKKYNYIFNENNIEKYDSVILGSSRVMKIIPSHISEGKFYNFGVHTANNAEKLFLLQEWLKIKPLNKVYLGIDFYNFHKDKKPLSDNSYKFQEQYTHNYLSIETFKLSLKSLKYQVQNKPQTFFEDSGEINYFHKDRLIQENLFDFSDAKYEAEAEQNFMHDYSSFKTDARVYDILKQIHTLSVKHHFELYVFFTPSHISHISLVHNNPIISQQFQEIKTKTKSIFGTIYDFSSDKVSNINSQYFYDIFHYRSPLGDEIIKTLQNNGTYGAILK